MSKPRELWVDLSTSVRWDGGVIGIVRAELELARAMRALRPTTRFCAFNGEAFVEMQHERIKWLFESRSVADAYLKVRDYFRAAADYRQPRRGPQTVEYPRYQEMLSQLPPVAQNRMGQLRLSLLFGATAIPASELLLKGLLRLYEPLRGKKAGKGSKGGPGHDADTARPDDWALPAGTLPAPSPFGENATVLCAGWMDTGRERHLTAIKAAKPGLRIAQLVYDVIPIHEDLAHLYPASGSVRFTNYFSWVSKNADVVFTGGANTAKDVETYQRKLTLPTPTSVPVRFGDAKLAEELQYDPVRDYYPDDGTLLRMLKVARPFVLCVGTVEARKNHAVLYEAMRVLFDRHGVNTPLMVFAGIPDARTRDLMDSVARDPKTRDHILHIVPTDHQLQVAYRNAAFTVLPSLYEGWSLTLPESLSFGKFALVSDVAPLREIGEDRVEYLPPHEPGRWADRIEHYLAHPDELARREAHIKATWKTNTWTDCAQTMLKALEGVS